MEQWRNSVHPDDLDRVWTTIEKAKRERVPFAVEHRACLPPDGDTRWLSRYGRFLYDEAGAPIRFSGVSLDITARKQADQDLQQRNRQLDLVAHISRELILGGPSQEDLFKTIFVQVGELLNMEMFLYYRSSEDPNLLRLDTFGGITEAERNRFATMKVGDLLGGPDAEARPPLIVEDVPNSGQQGCDMLAAAGAKSYVSFSLIAANRWQGIVTFVSRHPTRVHPHELQVAQSICDQIAAMIERGRLLCEVRNSEERFRLAQQAARIGTFEWNLQTGVITWTPEMEAIYGLKPGEFPRTQQGWEPFLSPEDRDEVLGGIEQALCDGQQIMREFRIVRPDGSARWVAGRWQVFSDAQGQPSTLTGVNIDITARKETETELKRSERHLRHLLEALHIFVGVLTPDGIMIECNSASIKAACLCREDVIGTHYADSFWWNYSEESSRRIRNDIGRALLGERVRYDASVRVRNTEGQFEFITMDFALATLCDEADVVTHLVAIGVDISERMRAESGLRKSETLLREWAKELERRVEERTVELRLSHTRLRALANELNLAEQRERKRLAGELHDYLAQLLVVIRMKLRQTALLVTGGKAENLLKEADHVLTQSLDYTRTLVAELTPPALHEFGLTQALACLASQMQQHGLQVIITHQQEALGIPEDQAVLLFQSVRELLFNVLKHANAKQATVSVSVTPNHELHLSVTDDGCGFDPETLSKQQTNSKRFGLFSLRERLAAMGGRFEILSTVGQGTRALLVTPYWPDPSRVSYHEGKVASGKPTPKSDQERTEKAADHNTRHYPLAMDPSLPTSDSIRVLLTDDHAMVRQGLRSVLEEYADVTVVGEASNGAEALDQVETLRPSVVVMDINMPKMNGIQATAIIKDRHPETVIIGLSVQPGGANGEAMKKAGAVSLLTKEAAVEELYEAIQEALAGGRPLETTR